MERIDHSLPWSHLGSERQISVFRFGAGERNSLQFTEAKLDVAAE